MCHVSEFLVANRPFIPPPTPGFTEPAEANLPQWYGLGGGWSFGSGVWSYMVHVGAYQVIPKEAQDGTQNGGPRGGPPVTKS